MTETISIRTWCIPHRDIEYAEDSYVWKVYGPEALGVAVKSLDKYCNGNAVFRGQRNANWHLHSKFRRVMAGEIPPPKSVCTTETEREWNHWHFELVQAYLRRFGSLSAKLPEFARLCRKHQADLHFELHKSTQQYADVISDDNLSSGSNLVDFSSDCRVGLFFSAYDPNGDDADKPGALIIVDPTILNHIEERLTRVDGDSQILVEFREDLENGVPKADFPLYKVHSSIPCARTKAQKAAYLAQMDFRHCATLPWQVASEKMRQQHFCKIEYPAELKPAVLAYCAEHGIDARTMYPDDPFWTDTAPKIGVRL